MTFSVARIERVGPEWEKADPETLAEGNSGEVEVLRS